MVKPVCALLGGVLLAGSVAAQQWFALGQPDAPSGLGRVEVEVDLDTVGLRAQGGDTVIRVTFDVLQPHPAGYGFRSFIATAQFDCQRRTVSLSSAAYYALPAGGGVRLGADSSGREAGMPLDLVQRIPASTRLALLKATCAGQN